MLEYIATKIIGRGLIASIVPIFVYSVLFFLAFPQDAYFFDTTPWLIILGVSVVPGFNHLCLYIIFEPITYYIYSELKIDPATNPA